MSKIAFVFPGQGSQHPGMGKDLADTYKPAADILSAVDKKLGESLSGLMFNGPEETLTLTANAQPALLTASVAAHTLLADEGITPDYVAGHSLGEYSAIVAAGGLSVVDAAYAVRRRGQFMQEAVPVGQGGMAAIIGLDMETVRQVCHEAVQGEEVLAPANINSAAQIVIAGHLSAIERAMPLAKEKGAKRALPLQVSAPFHSSLMEPARVGMRGVLEAIEFSDLKIPLINNADVDEITDKDSVKEGLIKQIVSPVRWQETMEALASKGVTTFVEIGPGRVLSGLLKRAVKGCRLLNVEDSESLEKTITALKG